MTDGKDEPWSPAKMSVARRQPWSVLADSSTPALQPQENACTASSRKTPTRRHVVLPKKADLARHEESNGDGRVDVTAADVCNYPDNRCDAEAERQRDPHDIARLTRATADKYQQQRAEEFGDQRQPELERLHVLNAVRRHLLTL